MNTVVVYHSMWGSCQKIAEAIAQGLIDSGHDSRTVAVLEAEAPDSSVNLIDLGAALSGLRGRPS
ncbi:MAG: flavodoxin family protein [Candidatus Geothermincolia bacterium]